MVKSKKFPGQPIFSQVLQLIPREILSGLVKQYGSDRYVKKFKTFDQLVAMLFCALERCTSTREVQTGLQVWEGRLVHLGVHSYPCRSTLSDANRRCPEALFGDLYHALVKLYYPQLFPDSRAALSQSERLFIIDSSTIELFQDVMRGAGMGKMDGRRKGGVKAHTMINAAHNIPCLVYLSEAKENDRVVMDKIDVPKGSILVFDKGYVKYRQWQKWTEAKIYWVTRLNDEAYYQVLEDRPVNEKQANAGVSEDQLILLGSGTTPGSEVIMARRVKYYDADKERWFVFVTNHTQFSASHIADLYRKRWQIETLFKSVKQNFQFRYFLGESANAICIQIWCALIADLLLKVIQRSVKKKTWALSNLSAMIRMHLATYVDIFAFLNNPEKALRRALALNPLQGKLIFDSC